MAILCDGDRMDSYIAGPSAQCLSSVFFCFDYFTFHGKASPRHAANSRMYNILNVYTIDFFGHGYHTKLLSWEPKVPPQSYPTNK